MKKAAIGNRQSAVELTIDNDPVAAFGFTPHEVSRNELTLEAAFQEIDLLQRENFELRVVLDLLKIRVEHLETNLETRKVADFSDKLKGK